MIELTFDGTFNDIRSEPRFQELVKRVSVPQHLE
jgi:hypothetical protein